MNTTAMTTTLLITTRTEMSREVSTLAGRHPITSRAPDQVTSLEWHEARLVLIDHDDLPAVMSRGLPSRDDVMVVHRGEPADMNWRRAVDLGVDRLLVLPDAADYLERRIAAASQPGAVICAVVGAATESAAYAAALAVAAAREGLATALLNMRTAPGPITTRLQRYKPTRPVRPGGDLLEYTAGERGRVPADDLARTLSSLAARRDLIVIDCAEADDLATSIALNAADAVIRVDSITG